MKKGLLHIGLLVSLVVMGVFTSSAQAQSTTRYRAAIPFDFSIGKKDYKAGNYIVDVKDTSSSVTWSLEDADGRNLQIKYVLISGNASNAVKTSLLFNQDEGQYSLTDMVTPEFSLKISRSKTAKMVASNKGKSNPKTETVAIVLTKEGKNIE